MTNHCPARAVAGKQTIIGAIEDTITCNKPAGHRGAHRIVVPPGFYLRGEGTWTIKL